LSPNFNSPSKGIKILGFLLGTSTFTPPFIKNVQLEDVRQVDPLPIMGDGSLWNFNLLFHATFINFLMMHTSIFLLHKIDHFFLFFLP
jgi:hypothetical protein